MSIRLGELLVERGALSVEQRDEILKLQEKLIRPFGVIAEERFGVLPSDIDQAWAEQYGMIASRVDPLGCDVDDGVLGLISKRQAWQFGLIPISDDGDEICFVTSVECLSRALRFVGWRMPGACSFGICDLHTLKLGLAMHYPFESLDSGMIDHILKHNPAA